MLEHKEQKHEGSVIADERDDAEMRVGGAEDRDESAARSGRGSQVSTIGWAVLARLRRLLVVLFLVTFMTFLLVDFLPGDPARALMGENASVEQVESPRQELGLDRPMPVRYVTWIGDVVTGDLGRSFRTGQPVWEAIVQRLPVSIELMVAAQVLALVIAVPIGIWAAYRRGRLLDRTTMATAFGLIAMPPFILGMVLIVVFAGWLSWFPATGWVPISQSISGNFKTAFLPSITLSTGLIAVYQQLLRSDMIATLQQDYVLMAKAKGLPTRHILWRHALRPSSFSLVTLAGLNMGRLIGGSVIVEVLFALPGLGQLMVQSIATRDFIILQGVILVVAVAYVLINMAVDIVYTILDPRVRPNAR